MANPGTLDRPAALYQLSSVQGPTGEATSVWVKQLPIFAKVEQPAPGSRIQSDGVTARTLSAPTLLIRWTPVLAPGQDITKWQVVMNDTGQTFRILDSAETFGRMNYLRLIVETQNGLPQ